MTLLGACRAHAARICDVDNFQLLHVDQHPWNDTLRFSSGDAVYEMPMEVVERLGAYEAVRIAREQLGV